jgi:thioredoxin 1
VEFEGKVAIKKVNIDENPEAPANFGIRSIPTMILFKNGSIADTKIGLSSEADLKNWLNSFL